MLLIAVVLRILEYDYVVALSSVHDDDADNGSSSGETRSNWCCRLSLRLNLNMLRNKQPGKYINESHPSFTAERMAFVLGNTTKFPSTTKQLRRSWWCSFVYVEEHFATRGAHCFMIVFQSKMMRRIVLSRTQRLSSDSPTASLLGRLPQPTRESHFRLPRQPGLRMK